MDLFPKSNKDIFRKRIIVKDSDDDLLKASSAKWWLVQWESASKQRPSTDDNETALEREMAQTMGQIHSFLHRLEVTALVHSKNGPGKKGVWTKSSNREVDRQFRSQLQLGHTLRNKVEELLELEDMGIRLSKSFQSTSNKSSVSGNNIMQESESGLSCSHYGTEIKDVLRKFNKVLKKKDISNLPQLQEIEVTEESKPMEQRNDGDSLQFLTNRLIVDNIQPIFKSKPRKPTDALYSVTCQVFKLKEEGQAPEKVAAKKASAVKMLERLVNDSLAKRLPPQITPFSEYELKEAVCLLCATEHYDVILAQLCADYRKPPPCYTTDSQQELVHINCSALGHRASGIHKNPIVAQRMAAREVLLLFKEKPKY